MSEPTTKVRANRSNGAAGAVFFLGLIGALVHYMQAAHGFGAVVVGILKSLVWPAFLVYHLLGL